MKLGVLVNFTENIHEEIKKVRDLGFSSCQLSAWNEELFTDAYANAINHAAEEYGVTISTFWCGWSGPQVWDFYEGPLTLGLLPETYRLDRIKTLKKGSDFAKKLGVKNLATHVGFLPEVALSTEYSKLVCAIRELAEYIKANSQFFLFETGQETPVTLRRMIEDVGTDNLGINLDPANLILYGKANPVDALEVFGTYVRDVHGKDGLYPTDGRHLGKEMPLGEGKVNFPLLISRLKELGYDGPITIEREISGEEQIQDIIRAKTILEALI